MRSSVVSAGRQSCLDSRGCPFVNYSNGHMGTPGEGDRVALLVGESKPFRGQADRLIRVPLRLLHEGETP